MTSDQFKPDPNVDYVGEMLSALVRADTQKTCESVVSNIRSTVTAHNREEREAAELLEESQVLLKVAIDKVRRAWHLVMLADEYRKEAFAEVERTLGGR